MCPKVGLRERLRIIHIPRITPYHPVTFASSAVRDGFGHVPVVTLLAVVTVASCCVVATVETDSTASTAGQLVQLHVKTTAAGMQIAVAG